MGCSFVCRFADGYRVAPATFRTFDTGSHTSGASEPERFCHGFVPGLMAELSDRCLITSNRESGSGHYDVLPELFRKEPEYGAAADAAPNALQNRCRMDKAKDMSAADAIILEFKVYRPNREKNLEETVKEAHRQIKDKQYAASPGAKRIPAEHIRQYGFAFDGKHVPIG